VKVLGIDPGTAACGFGIVHESGGRLTAVEFGWWQTSARDAPQVRLKRIHDEVAELIARHEPAAVALEESYVGADARTALSVGQARGAALVACAAAEVAAPRRRRCSGWCAPSSASRRNPGRITRPTPSRWRSATHSRLR
jgi:crossover junction endodeoxyribonuclease RuvC